jgi:hybrid cluster-associated redox disulfide protein
VIMATLLEFDAMCMPRIAQELFDASQTAEQKPARAEIATLFASAQRAATTDAQTGTMKKIALPTSEMTVDTVMRRWPSTIRVFVDFGMHCVGCPIATFHSVDEACSEHGIDPGKFLERLCETAQPAQAQPAQAQPAQAQPAQAQPAQTWGPAEMGRGWPSASPNRA